MSRNFLFLFSAGLFLGTAGCSTPLEPRNLSGLKEEIIRYVDSGRYQQQIEKISADATTWIEQRAAARESSARFAVVFDIDETILSNLPHMRSMDFGYQPTAWSEWVARGEAPAIDSVREVYRRARQLGVEAIFITGRHERDRGGTEKNLRGVGASEYALIFFKPDESKETSEKFKIATRARLVAEGWVIIANIGDQESDLSGGFAERIFKLPAPFYLTQ